MHHPPRNLPKTLRNELQTGTALLIGRQGVDLPRFRQSKTRDNRHAKSLVCKERFFSKIQDLQLLSAHQLKINGRQLGSSLNTDPFKVKAKPKKYSLNRNFLQEPEEGYFDNLTRERQEETVHSKYQSALGSSPEKGIGSLGQLISINQQKQNSSDENSKFPQISTNQIAMNSVPLTEKKTYQYRTAHRRSDRDKDNLALMKKMKRRDTVIEHHQEKGGYKGEQIKNKQQFKKVINLMQYRQFLLSVNLTNQLINPPEDQVLYKAYICKGNNGLLVKSIFKTRPWWSFRVANEIENCSLVWTEWKRNKTMEQLSTLRHKELIKNPPLPYKLQIKTNNREIREKMEKKFWNLSKVVGKNFNICKKYENSMLSENYFTNTSKINNKAFEQVCRKMVNLEQCRTQTNKDRKLVNHIPGCFYLHSKKLLFTSMAKYYKRLNKDVFTVIPKTFLITKGINDPQYASFCQYFQETASKGKKGSNVWICKPGQNSNRGHGIEVVRALVSQKCGSSRTLIVQKYMENPYLYNKRKFDIRVYILITCVNGCVKGYWYEEGYARTTSKQYTLKNLDNKLIHLTNDAIQKKGEEYGKFEGCNKITLTELERYVEANSDAKFKPAYDKMKSISTELIEAVSRKINPQHKQYCFEVFGLDFMLDDKLNPFLIEANSNPCLEVDGSVLGKVIPRMIQNVLRVAVDPIFPPPYSQVIRNKYIAGSSFQTNQMVLVYDSLHDNPWPSKQEVDEEAELNQKECQQFEGEDDE